LKKVDQLLGREHPYPDPAFTFGGLVYFSAMLKFATENGKHHGYFQVLG
jgi:hypothetical protein